MQHKRITLLDIDHGSKGLLAPVIESIEGLELLRVYTNFKDLLLRLSIDRPHMILINFGIEHLLQVESLRKLRNEDPYADVIILADLASEDFLLKCMNYGVCGFLPHKSSLSQIEEALLTVSGGAGYLDGHVARRLIESLYKNTSSPLTSRETQVLQYLYLGKTYTMIAQELRIASETVKTHIKNIYDKLNVNSKAAAIAKALDNKLIK